METLLKEQSLTNVEETKEVSSNSEIVKREDVKDTPFTIITTEEGVFGVMGEYRITEVEQSISKVRQEIKKVTWNRIVQVMMILEEVRTNKLKN